MTNINEATDNNSSLREALLPSKKHKEKSEDQDEERGTADGSSQDSQVSLCESDAPYEAGWKDLLSICYPDIQLILYAFVFLVLAALAQILVPRYTGNILDSIAHYSPSGDENFHNIWKVPGFSSNMKLLIISSVLGAVFSGIRGSIFTVIGGRVNTRLRLLLMDSLLSQDIGFFDTTKTGDITSRLSSDTTLVGDQVSLNVNVFLRSLVQAIGVLIFMGILSWRLTLVAFISVPIISIISKVYGEYVRKITKDMQKKLADGNIISTEALSSMSTVRSFGAELFELKEFKGCMNEYLQLTSKNAWAYLGYCTFSTALPQLVTAVILFYGGLLVMSNGKDHITSGQLVTFLLYLTSLSDAFNSIGYIFSSLTQAVGAADKIFELMNRKPKRASLSDPDNLDSEQGTSVYRTEAFRGEGAQPYKCNGEVSLSNVHMYYPSRPDRKVLNGMDLIAPPGAIVALVGASGGGKSSIVSLVQNLYEPCNGEVCIDGRNVQTLCPEWMTKYISVVSQEPTLFARSIRRNIMYGLESTDLEPSLEEIKNAARLSNASTFIDALPMQYETDVGERGVQLSGGQKQRIAIARALVRKPRILLLDEATSALDADSEASVQEAIDTMLLASKQGVDESLQSSMTVIAHRLSTIRNADVIHVVEAGKIVESGSHDDLIQNSKGAYFNLIGRQIKAQSKLDRNISSNSISLSVSQKDLCVE